MSIKRGSSVDQVGLVPQTNVGVSDIRTGQDPIALPDGISPDGGGAIANLKDGGMNEKLSGAVGVKLGDAVKTNFVANDGCKNP